MGPCSSKSEQAKKEDGLDFLAKSAQSISTKDKFS